MSTHDSAPTIDELLAHAEWVRRLARELVRDEERADDVVQETWLAALRSPPRTAENVRGWLARVARNAAHKLRRAEHVRSEHEERAARPEATTDEIAARAGVQRDLVDRVLALEEPYRSVLLLVYFEQLSTDEVARRLGVPAATVRTRQARGLEQLRRRLARDYSGRERWCLAFAALAREPGIASVAAGAGVGVYMLTKWKLVAAALLVFALVAAWLVSQESPRSPLAAADDVQRAELDADRELSLAPAFDANGRAAAASVADGAARARVHDGLRVHGRILDVYGAPLAGVAIKQLENVAPRVRGPVAPPDDAERAALAALPPIVSDAEGRFALTTNAANVRAVVHALRVSQPGWVQVGAGTRFDANDREELIVVAAPGERVTGVVVDEGGHPLAGVVVEPRLAFMWMPSFPLVLEDPLPSSLGPNPITDDSGAFEFSSLPRVPTLSLSTGLPLGLLHFESTRVEPFAPGVELPLRIVLRGENLFDRALVNALDRKHGGGGIAITGRVVARDGTPASAQVQFGSSSTQTRSDGSFLLVLNRFNPADFTVEDRAFGGPADLVAVSRGFQPARVADFVSQALEPSARTDIVLQLGPPALTIRGRVVGSDGKPRSRAHVGLGGPGLTNSRSLEELMSADDREHETTTDANGNFVVDGLLPREYRLHALDLVDHNEVTSEPILAGAEHVELRFQGCDWLTDVRGIVVSRDGRPVRGATVTVESGWPSGGGQRLHTSHQVIAGGDGRFVFETVPLCGRLAIYGENVGECRPSVEQFTRETEWRIVAPRTVRFVVRAKPGDAVTGFKVLDERGQTMRVSDNRVDGTHMVDYVQLLSGSSGVCLVDDTAHELVLFAGAQELRRIPLTLDYEMVQTIVP